MKNKEFDYCKGFSCGKTFITRCLYETLPCPMDTSSLTDADMQKLADAIDSEMSCWLEWLKHGDITEDKYQEQWWQSMEYLGFMFGMTYYEDED
jgi:hypothetical protein